MKKFFAFIGSGILLTTLAFAQKPSFSSPTGKYIADLYTGFSIYNAIQDNIPAGAMNAQKRNIGTSGIRLQRMVSEHGSIGVDINYSEIYTSYLLPVPNISRMRQQQRFRVQAHMEYHFKKESQRQAFDPYMAFSIGYKNTQRSYATNDPNWKPFLQNQDLTPLGMRASIGLRYYFSDQLGFNTEVGAGGAIVQVGLSGKF